MISLKTIQTSLIPTNDALYPSRGLSRKKSSTISLCKSNDESGNSPPEGDAHQQELLAKIAMLQAQKVRLTDYLDERSAYLTQFAEEANEEFDKIGEEALRGLDEAGARIMENIESRMQAFKESAELSKVEIEENEKKLADFEGQIEKDRNEGLFFKNLIQKAPCLSWLGSRWDCGLLDFFIISVAKTCNPRHDLGGFAFPIYQVDR